MPRRLRKDRPQWLVERLQEGEGKGSVTTIVTRDKDFKPSMMILTGPYSAPTDSGRYIGIRGGGPPVGLAVRKLHFDGIGPAYVLVRAFPDKTVTLMEGGVVRSLTKGEIAFIHESIHEWERLQKEEKGDNQ